MPNEQIEEEGSMKKLEYLSKEQERLSLSVRDEWLDLMFDWKNRKEIDETKLREQIKWLYTLAGLKKIPKDVIVFKGLGEYLNFFSNKKFSVRDSVWDSVRDSVRDSVVDSVRDSVWDSVRASVGASVRASVRDSVRASVGASVRDSVGASVWDSVRDSVWDSVWDSVRDSVGASVWDSVRDSVWDSVWDSVRDSVGASVWDSVRDSVRDSVGDSVGASVGDQSWSGFNAFYDFFERIGIVKNEDFAKYKSFCKQGIMFASYFENAVAICPLPSYINYIDRGGVRILHDETGPAIAWKDGYKIHFLHGVRFDDLPLWKSVVEKTIEPKDLLAIKNMEIRMASMKTYGLEHMIKEIGAKLVDKSEKGNELYRIDDLFDRPEFMLRYECPSTGRVYSKFVNYTGTSFPDDADKAQAGTFKLSKQEYLSMYAES